MCRKTECILQRVQAAQLAWAMQKGQTHILVDLQSLETVVEKSRS